MPPVAQPAVAQLPVEEPPINAADGCTSEPETIQRNLGNGITISQAKLQHLMAQPKDSVFVREAAKAIWGVQNLYNRSITGTPCRRFLYKEDGPSGVEKQALTPRKLDALRILPAAVSALDGSMDSVPGFVGAASAVSGSEPSGRGDAHPGSCRSLVPGSTPSDVVASSYSVPTFSRLSGAVRMRIDASSSSDDPPAASGSSRPLPRQLRDLISDSSEEAIPVHHTSKDCGREFSSLLGLSQHRRHAHFNAYNADIVITRVKPRWLKEESILPGEEGGRVNTRGH
ncbi:hypothetical protein MTO96_006359 [Rhipicephalus appendiculatus]